MCTLPIAQSLRQCTPCRMITATEKPVIRRGFPKNSAGWKISTPPRFSRREFRARFDSDESLVQHRIRHLQEAGDIGAVYEIARSSIGIRRLVAGLVNGDHYFVQPIVHFFAGPG